MSCEHNNDDGWAQPNYDVWAPPVRCTGCGHRVALSHGCRPIESRKLPWWTWPAEIVMRWTARRMNGAAPHVLSALTGDSASERP